MAQQQTSMGTLKSHYNSGIKKWSTAYGNAMKPKPAPTLASKPKEALGRQLQPFRLSVPDLPTFRK